MPRTCNAAKQPPSDDTRPSEPDAKETKALLARTRSLKARRLTPKQTMFVREYLLDLNATQAAIRAGYSKKAAAFLGHDTLRNPKVAEEIARLQGERAKRLDITADKVLQELALLGFANMKDYIRTQGDGMAYVDLSNLTREQAAAIQEIVTEEYTEGRGDDARAVRRVKFKLAEKRGALELLARHLRLLGDVGVPPTSIPIVNLQVNFVEPKHGTANNGNHGNGRLPGKVAIPVRATPL